MPITPETPEQQRLRQERERAAEALYRARGMDPGRAAIAGRAAAVLGLPPSVVRENEELLTQARVRQEAAALSEAQRSIRWLGQPGNAEVAHDQVESLSAMERLYNTFSAPINAMLAVQNRQADSLTVTGDLGRQAFGGAITGVGTAARGLGRTVEIAGTGTNPASRQGMTALGQMLAEAGQRIERGGRNAAGQLTAEERASATRNLMPNSADMGLATDVAGGLGQLGGQALMAIGTGGTSGALPLLFGQGVGQMDERVQNDMAADGRTSYGVGDMAALLGGGAVTALSEKLGLDAILGRMPASIRSKFTSAFADILFAGAAEGVSEITEGVGQNALAMTLLGEDTGLLDGTVEGGSVGALVGSIARAAILTAIPGRQYVRDTMRAERADGSANDFDKLVESVAGSELLSRSAPHLRDFLSSIDASGTVYLPAEAAATFFQSSPENEALLDQWDLRDQYEQAMVSGADIAIPTATYLTQVAPSGAHEVWRDEVRHGLEAMSVKEAAAWKESGEAQLESDLADAATTAAKIATEGSPAQRVYQDWLDQGRTAGLTRDVADANAVIMARLFERRAARNPTMFPDAWAAYKDANVTIARAFPESLRAERPDARLMTLYTALKAGKAAPSQRAMFGRSLAEFVSAEGGMFDTGGELAAMGADQWHRGQRFRRKLVRTPGEGNFGSDYVAERAIAAGYLPEGSNGNDLLEALRNEMAGRPVFSTNAERDLATEDNARALDDLEELLANAGLNAQTATYEEVKRAVDALADAPTTPPGVAYEQSMEQARALAETYKAMSGIDKPAFVGPVQPVVEDMKAIADALEAAKHAPKNAKVKKAYRALIDETVAQFLMMGDITVEAWRGEGEPYANSKAMLADVRSGHLWFFLTDNGFGEGADSSGHPLLEKTGIKLADGTELLANDLFRIVHDFFGHAQQGFNFGPVGELNAYLEHASMYSDEAVPALAAETLMQNAWVNFGPHLRREDGSLPAKGEDGFVPIPERRFADQKAFIATPEVLALAEKAKGPLAQVEASPVDAALVALQELGQPNPLNERELVVDGGGITARKQGQKLFVSGLRAIERGGGRRAMEALIRVADASGATIELWPIPSDAPAGKTMTQEALRDWYAGLGFAPSGPNYMARQPTRRLKLGGKMRTVSFNQPDGTDAPGLQRPPVNPDGTITLTHYSVEPALTETDPTKWGRSGNFLPREERNMISSHLKRTYFGIGVGMEGGYRPEFSGRTVYVTEIDASRLYDAAADPDGFRDNLDGVPQWDRINKIERQIEAAGYDGYWLKNVLGMTATVFKPMPVRPEAQARVFNQSDEDVAPPFFSALERAVEASPTTKAPAAQWKATLAKTPGVKKEEIDIVGLNDWLDMTAQPMPDNWPAGFTDGRLLVDAKGNVSKDAVLAFVRAGGVRLDEVVLGDPVALSEASERQIVYEVERALREFDERPTYAATESDRDDGSWTIYNRDNYIQWQDQSFATEAEAEAFAAEQNALKRAAVARDAEDYARRDVMENARESQAGRTRFAGYFLKGMVEGSHREILLTTPDIEGPSTHWDVPNVIAHARIAEAALPPGEPKTMVVGENQSDWHQKGRDQGYAADVTPERRAEVEGRQQKARAAYVEAVSAFVRAAADQLDVVAAGYGEAARKESEVMGSLPSDTLSSVLQAKHSNLANRLRQDVADTNMVVAVSDAYRTVIMRMADNAWSFGGSEARKALIPLKQQADQANLERNEADQAVEDLGRGIPDGPWRTSWSALVMKRLIRYAVDNGFERVVWINGNQQNGGQTGGDGSFFYERNLVNVTNDLLKKHGAKVGPVDFRSKDVREADKFRLENPEEWRRLAIAEEVGLGATPEAAARAVDSPSQAFSEDRPTNKLGIQNGFTITPALKAQAMSGFPLFQKGKAKGPRGQIDFSDPEKAAITLFSKADPTTPFHEAFGHLSLELLIRDAADPRSSPQTQQDLATVLGYLNVRDPRDIGRDQHELWASTAERYLFEGRAPSVELRDVMRRIKSWFVGIYRTVKHAQIDVPITDEIRAVMDRLLASEDEIVTAREQLKIEAGFTDAAAAGMTEEAFADYQRLVARARDDADDELLRRTMRVIRQKRREEWNAEADAIREEVTAEIDSQPDIRAVNWLRGSKVALNREIVIAMLGDAAGIKLLPGGVPPLVSKNGVHPDSVAEVAGYGSGMELLDGLAAHEAETRSMRAMKDKRSVRQARIDREIEARVNEILGDPLTDGSVEAEAMAALHTGRQAEVLAIELGVLSRRVGNTPPPLAALRSWARAQIGSRPVRDARSGKFLRAERSAANAVQKALAAGDRQEAARQKQSQVMNHLLYSEARHAEEFAARAVRRLGKLDQKRTMRSMDQEYLEQIHALLEQYDLRKASGRQVERRKSLMEFVNAQLALGNEIHVPEELIDAASKQHYTDLTVDELRALDDTVRSLAHLGRMKQTLLDNRDRRDFEQVIDEMLGQVMDLKNRKGLEERNRKPNRLRKFDAALWKMETLFDWLDKDEVNGVFNRVLLRPAVDAANREDQLHETVGRALRAVYDAVPKDQKKKWLDKVVAPELTDMLTGKPSQFVRSDLIAMALNVGNASNLDKLARGEEWADADIMTVLNRELTAEEWTFVQGVWDGLEILWPDIAAAERRLTGVEPERVDPQEVVTTTAGTLRGGYYPVKYDRSRDPNANQWAAAEASDLFSGVITGAATPKGHTISRTGYAGPILLSVEGVLFGHLNSVIARIAYGEYVASALKFIRDPRVRATVTNKVGPEYYDQLEPWLKAQVTDRARNDRDLEGIEAFVKQARMNVQMVAMGFRVSTGLAQIAGFAQSAAVVGNVRLAANIVKYAASIRAGRNDLSDFVFEKSEELRQRMSNRDRDMRDMMRDLIGKGGALPAIQRAAFVHIGVMDQFVSVPTWMAAYEEAIERGADEADAVALGDKAVRRTQGTGREYALASVQRPNSEFMKLFTLFYSYFSVQYNRQRDIARYSTTGDAGKAISMTFWVMMMAPVMGALLTGDWPDEDDGDDPLEKWVSFISRKVFFNLFAGVPYVRDLTGTIERKVAGEFSSYSISPVSSAGSAVLRTGDDITDLLTGEEVSEKWLKNTIQTAGYFVGLPTGQISSTAQYVKEVFDGTQAPDNVAEFLYGLAKGPQESQES